MATKVPPERQLVLVLGLVLAAPVIVWAVWPRSPGFDDPPSGYSTVCESVAGEPLGVIAYTSASHNPEHGSSYTVFRERYTAYDLRDGHVVAKFGLGSHRSDANTKISACATNAAGQLWLQTPSDGFHVRDPKTGAILRSQRDLMADLGAIDKAWFDFAGHKLVVATKDGRNHEIPVPGSSPFAGAPTESTPHGPRARTSRGELGVKQLPGGSRVAVTLDGRALADTDWLQPALVVHPPSGTLEWPSPPSVIICERTEVRGPYAQLTRVGLDGEILWTYVPGTKPALDIRSCAWIASGDGTRLVLMTKPNGIVAIDPATGREAFRELM